MVGNGCFSFYITPSLHRRRYRRVMIFLAVTGGFIDSENCEDHLKQFGLSDAASIAPENIILCARYNSVGIHYLLWLRSYPQKCIGITGMK